MDADNRKPPSAADDENLTQLVAAAKLSAERFLTEAVGDEEVDRVLREAGGDPEAIARRGREQVAAHLAKLRGGS